MCGGEWTCVVIDGRMRGRASLLLYILLSLPLVSVVVECSERERESES